MKKAVFALVLLAIKLSVAQASIPQANREFAAGEHHAELAGVKFWYSVAGTGPVLVIQAPGWGVGSEYLRNGLAPLGQHFTLVYYDTRGSVRSRRPTDPKRMTTPDMVDDLEHLREFWRLDSMTLVGHSHGGAIALGYAIRYPKRVHKLVLVDSCIEDHDLGAERDREIAVRKNDPRFKDAIASMTSDFDPKTDEQFDSFLKRVLPLYFYDPVSALPRFAKTDTGPLPSVWAYHAFGAPDKPLMKEDGSLNRIEAQTLVIVGQADWICPVAEAERIHQGIRNSQLVVLDKSGHFPWIETPEQFFAEIMRFAK